MKVIAEKEDIEENVETGMKETEENEDNKGREENEYGENCEEEENESGTIMKLLITKKHMSTEDETDQDVIVETFR